METMNNVMEVAAKKGLLTKENGILALAAIGAGTVVYGGIKLGKNLFNRFSKPEAPAAVAEAPAQPVAQPAAQPQQQTTQTTQTTTESTTESTTAAA